MKFNELSKEQQQVLTAWINGETIQYFSHSGDSRGLWCDMRHPAILIFERQLRVKPKEPVVHLYYSTIFNDGILSRFTYYSISEVNQFHSINKIHSYIQKTYHDGVFVKAEVIPKLELSLKGLM